MQATAVSSSPASRRRHHSYAPSSTTASSSIAATQTPGRRPSDFSITAPSLDKDKGAFRHPTLDHLADTGVSNFTSSSQWQAPSQLPLPPPTLLLSKCSPSAGPCTADLSAVRSTLTPGDFQQPPRTDLDTLEGLDRRLGPPETDARLLGHDMKHATPSKIEQSSETSPNRAGKRRRLSSDASRPVPSLNLPSPPQAAFQGAHDRTSAAPQRSHLSRTPVQQEKPVTQGILGSCHVSAWPSYASRPSGTSSMQQQDGEQVIQEIAGYFHDATEQEEAAQAEEKDARRYAWYDGAPVLPSWHDRREQVDKTSADPAHGTVFATPRRRALPASPGSSKHTSLYPAAPFLPTPEPTPGYTSGDDWRMVHEQAWPTPPPRCPQSGQLASPLRTSAMSDMATGTKDKKTAQIQRDKSDVLRASRRLREAVSGPRAGGEEADGSALARERWGWRGQGEERGLMQAPRMLDAMRVE